MTETGDRLDDETLSILEPSVNALSLRIFARAAGLDPAEVAESAPELVARSAADLTPLVEDEALPQGSLWEGGAVLQYLCNKHGLERFYPSDAAERAMVDSAMFYLVGTVYPLLARAAEAHEAVSLEGPLDVYHVFFLRGRQFIGGDDPSIADIRFAATLEFLRAIDYRLPDWSEEYTATMRETPQRADAVTKIASATSRMRLCPKRSPSHPEVGMKTARLTR